MAPPRISDEPSLVADRPRKGLSHLPSTSQTQRASGTTRSNDQRHRADTGLLRHHEGPVGRPASGGPHCATVVDEDIATVARLEPTVLRPYARCSAGAAAIGPRVELSGPRLGPAVGGAHAAVRNMGVERGGRAVRVTEQGLNIVQFGSSLEQVRGKGMAETLR
jgi:hypothetical protein